MLQTYMASQGELIVNTSYKDLFSTSDNIRKDFFIFPEIDNLKNIENTDLTRSLALLLAANDSASNVQYGIEIKSNGSERSSRIPLVRVSDKTVSIWKVSSGVGSLEKAVTALNELFYFLKEHSDEKYALPEKVVILKEDENVFVGPDSEYADFVKRIVIDNNIFLFSLDFIENKIKNKESIAFDSIFSSKKDRVMTIINS